MKRPTIKRLQDFAWELHIYGIERCMEAHRIGAETKEGCQARGKAHAYKYASELVRKLIDFEPLKVVPEEPKK